MNITDNPFTGLPLATIKAMQSEFVACIRKIAVGGQSYTIEGRTFTRANMKEVKETLLQLNQAVSNANGGGVKFAYGIHHSGTNLNEY